ncbi:MAG TPA: tetratricopeptide repeat protein, partial [Thermoanaerobaculia bacterium]|nr:tetratricopeptide repeat protein [Thermoanaerobaculia bacterium]
MRTCLLVLLALAAAASAEEVSQVQLFARDLHQQPVRGVRFSLNEVRSGRTTRKGEARLDVPASSRTGQQVKIQLVPDWGSQGDWFLVNPQVNLAELEGQVELVLMRRSEFRRLAAEVRDAPRLGSAWGPESEDPQALLAQVATRYGLTPEQLESAIRSFADTPDPKDQGIAAYLERQYAQAESLLGQAADKKERDLVETLRYLGATQYEQAKYREAEKNFRKALALRE